MSAARIKDRYFRSVIAHPTGAIVHDGDCYVWNTKICTCGLLHALVQMGNPYEAKKLYPKYDTEVSMHLAALDTASNR